jgi:Zn ribbon nucleic-acid-binding protein
VTICETAQAECPKCRSPKMFITTVYDSDRGNFEDEYCPDCGHSHDSADGDIDDSTEES